MFSDGVFCVRACSSVVFWHTDRRCADMQILPHAHLTINQDNNTMENTPIVHGSHRIVPPKMRESPKHAAKDKANKRLSAMHPPPIPVATVVEEVPGNFECSPTDGPFMAPPRDSISRRLHSFESSEDDDDLSIPSTMRVVGAKMTGLDDKSDLDDDSVDPPESPLISPTADHNPPTPTDNEVSRYSFVDRLKH